MEIFRANHRKPKGYILLKVIGFFVKNCQDMKKCLNKITIVSLKIYLQLVIFSLMAIILIQ